jgi:type IV pilus assembly protein PilY1
MSNTRYIVAVSALLTMAAGGYLYYRANAAQGDGALAQAPLSNTAVVPPAFIMALDDSSSMTYQILLAGPEASAFYSGAEALAGYNGFFVGTAPSTRPRTIGDALDAQFYYVIPHAATMKDLGTAVPPLDEAALARSSDFNRTYFDPTITYKPWRKSDGNGGFVDYPPAVSSAALLDPEGPAADVINLTTDYRPQNVATDFSGYFVFISGMRLPAGTEYYMAETANPGKGNCGGLTRKSAGNTTWSKIGVNGWTIPRNADGSIARCGAVIPYFPATYYSKSATPAAGSGFNPAKVSEILNGCGRGCKMYRYRIEPGNYSSAGDYQRAIANFANWFVYYRDRNLTARGALSVALEGVDNMRVGLFTINSALELQAAAAALAAGTPLSQIPKITNLTYPDVVMRDFSDAQEKAAFYQNEIAKSYGKKTMGGTPNRYAVNAMGLQFMRRNDGAPVQAECQKNIGMLVTDGWATDYPGPQSAGNADGGMPAPLRDGYSNTMADFVAKYYLANLRPDLPTGKVPVPEEACAANPNDPKLDCRRDPHMNFYAITFGVNGSIYGKTYNPATNTPDPYVNYPKWPAIVTPDATAVDDLWHASMNGRGRYIDAATPTGITTAMQSIINSISQNISIPSGATGMTGTRVGGNTLSVQPEYAAANNGTDWYSRLRASRLVNGIWTQAWEASTLLGAGRKISYGDSSSGIKPQVKSFTSASFVAGSFQQALCDSNDHLQNCAGKFDRIAGGVTADEAVAYLRGDRTNDGGKLRRRTTLLGDIVNSTPLVTGANDDYGYMALDGDKLKYEDYLRVKRSSNRKPFVYVGANDGMFHAFDGTSGNEAFAYIPSTSLGHMGNLLFPYRAEDGADQVFKHRYYVDGPITAQDAYWGSSWKTVVVASVGAGGHGVFALDVTDQSKLDVLWELNDRLPASNGGEDIGSVLGEAAVVPVKDASGTVSWKAVFGNGYGSVKGDAVLFVVDMATGAVDTIRAKESEGTLPTRAKNGLGNIVAIDRYAGVSDDKTSDGYADTVYAGDLNGAVWKFDLREKQLALGGKPLFVARYKDDYAKRQPVTGGFEATTIGQDVMIFFGTGSYSFTQDPKDKSMQTMYALLDRDQPITGRSQLLQQFVYNQVAAAEDQRAITQFRPSVNQFGWFLDLGLDSGKSGNPIEQGERFVGNPRIWNGKLLFPTYEPLTIGTCSSPSTNWLYALDVVTGAASMLNGNVAETGSVLGEQVGAIRGKAEGSGSAKGPSEGTSLNLTSPSPDLYAAGNEPTEADQRCYAIVRAPDLPTVKWVRACGRQSWRQLR